MTMGTATGRWLRLLAAPAAALALALAARYFIVEPASVGLVCDGAPRAVWWCAARLTLIETFRLGVFGIASVVAGAAALWFGRRLAVTALALGLAGLVLYNAPLAGIGSALGLIVLARQQDPASAPDPRKA